MTTAWCPEPPQPVVEGEYTWICVCSWIYVSDVAASYLTHCANNLADSTCGRLATGARLAWQVALAHIDTSLHFVLSSLNSAWGKLRNLSAACCLSANGTGRNGDSFTTGTRQTWQTALFVYIVLHEHDARKREQCFVSPNSADKKNHGSYVSWARKGDVNVNDYRSTHDYAPIIIVITKNYIIAMSLPYFQDASACPRRHLDSPDSVHPSLFFYFDEKGILETLLYFAFSFLAQGGGVIRWNISQYFTSFSVVPPGVAWSPALLDTVAIIHDLALDTVAILAAQPRITRNTVRYSILLTHPRARRKKKTKYRCS